MLSVGNLKSGAIATKNISSNGSHIRIKRGTPLELMHNSIGLIAHYNALAAMPMEEAYENIVTLAEEIGKGGETGTTYQGALDLAANVHMYVSNMIEISRMIAVPDITEVLTYLEKEVNDRIIGISTQPLFVTQGFSMDTFLGNPTITELLDYEKTEGIISVHECDQPGQGDLDAFNQAAQDAIKAEGATYISNITDVFVTVKSVASNGIYHHPYVSVPDNLARVVSCANILKGMMDKPIMTKTMERSKAEQYIVSMYKACANAVAFFYRSIVEESRAGDVFSSALNSREDDVIRVITEPGQATPVIYVHQETLAEYTPEQVEAIVGYVFNHYEDKRGFSKYHIEEIGIENMVAYWNNRRNSLIPTSDHGFADFLADTVMRFLRTVAVPQGKLFAASNPIMYFIEQNDIGYISGKLDLEKYTSPSDDLSKLARDIVCELYFEGTDVGKMIDYMSKNLNGTNDEIRDIVLRMSADALASYMISQVEIEGGN